MHLKISPKVALLKIDSLIKEGAELFDFISNDYWEQEEKAEKLEKKKELAKEKELNKKLKEAAMEGKNTLNFLNIHPIIPTGIFGKHSVSEDIIKSYTESYNKWFRKAKNDLKDIYVGFTPQYLFTHADIKTVKTDPLFRDKSYTDYMYVKNSLEAEISVLVSLYKDLQNNIRSPLNYLHEKGQICFYDYICQLTLNTNESELCKYMFQFSIGEWKEMEDIYAFITGEDINDQHTWPKNWKNTIKNAQKEVNRKSKENFGFNVFKIEKTQLSLTLPSPLISGSK